MVACAHCGLHLPRAEALEHAHRHLLLRRAPQRRPRAHAPAAMPGTPQRSDTHFQRLWRGFLSARALVALALLLLQGAGLALHQNPEPELLALCALYLVVTVLTRLLAAPLCTTK